MQQPDSTEDSSSKSPGFLAAMFNTTKLKEPNQTSALVVRIAVVLLGKRELLVFKCNIEQNPDIKNC